MTVRFGRPLTAVTRLASLPRRTLRHGSRLKTLFVDVQPFVFSPLLVCFIFVVVFVVVVLFDLTFSTPFLSLTDSTRPVVVVFVVVVVVVLVVLCSP